MAADLTINIVEGASGGEAPTPPTRPVPAPPPVAVPMPPPFPVAPPVQHDRERAGGGEDRARKSDSDKLDRMSYGIVGIAQQIAAGLKVPSVDRLVGIGQSILTVMLGQRVIDAATGGVRRLLSPSPSLPTATSGPVAPPVVQGPSASRLLTPPVVQGPSASRAPIAVPAPAAAAGAEGVAGVSALSRVAGALASPIGVAVAAVAIVGAAFIAAGVVVRNWIKGMERNIEELAQYSGQLSAQRGIQAYEMTLLEMARTRRLEDPLSRMNDRSNRLEKLQYEAATEFYAIGAKVFALAEPGLDGMLAVAEAAGQLLKHGRAIEKILDVMNYGLIEAIKQAGGRELLHFLKGLWLALQIAFPWLAQGPEPDEKGLRAEMLKLLDGLQIPGGA